MAKDRRIRWQNKQLRNGKCEKCSQPAAPKYNSRGKVIGHRRCCQTCLDKDTQRKLARYRAKKAALVAA